MYRESLSLTVDPVRCSSCGTCVRECVNLVLEAGPSGRPAVAPGGEDRCIHCAHCLMACPSGALSIDGIDPDACLPVRPGADFASLLERMRRRRSIRHYQRKEVEPSVRKELFDALRHVPTGVNYGKLHFSVIAGLAEMDSFRESFYREIAARYAGTDVPEPERWSRLFAEGHDTVFRTAPHLVLACYDEKSFCGETDCVIALAHFELLANARGIGTVWFGRLMTILEKFMPELAEKLRVPPGYRPGYAMLFGYPDTVFYRTAEREAPSVTEL